jgi:hypothetical protein
LTVTITIGVFQSLHGIIIIGIATLVVGPVKLGAQISGRTWLFRSRLDAHPAGESGGNEYTFAVDIKRVQLDQPLFNIDLRVATTIDLNVKASAADGNHGARSADFERWCPAQVLLNLRMNPSDD